MAVGVLEAAKYRKYPGIAVSAAAFEAGGRPGEGLVSLVRRLGRALPLARRAQAISDVWQAL
eukprot:3669527-Alexandrium_andersonii.AAC.1